MQRIVSNGAVNGMGPAVLQAADGGPTIAGQWCCEQQGRRQTAACWIWTAVLPAVHGGATVDGQWWCQCHQRLAALLQRAGGDATSL